MKLVFIITATWVGGAEIMLHKVLTRLSPELKPHVISMIPAGETADKLRALGTPMEIRCVTTLAASPSLRRSMGQAGKERAGTHFNRAVQHRKILQICIAAER